MTHARDDDDTRLVASQDYARLLAAYYPVVVERCRLRVPGQDAYDVAHAVVERLIHELRKGKRYPVPFRVVVPNVTRWKIAEFHTSGRITFELDEDDATAPDELQAVEDQYSVGAPARGPAGGNAPGLRAALPRGTRPRGDRGAAGDGAERRGSGAPPGPHAASGDGSWVRT
jgi:hypothetical protein